MWKKDKILVIDDSKFHRSALDDMLSDEYDILEAENGKEGLELLKKNYELVVAIILDIIMPVMDGYAFLEEYKKDERFHNIPVIVATTENNIETEIQCLHYGVWDFVPKPFCAEILKFRIMNTIKRSKSNSMEHDELSGLYNQQKFFQCVRDLLKHKPNRQYAFIRIDIDRFKVINSFYGSKEGDQLIAFLGKVIRELLLEKENCYYGRINADVFAVCMEYNKEDIGKILKEIRASIENYNERYYLQTAAGIYIISDNKMDVSTIYDKATIAANQCKNNYMIHEMIYTKEMDDKVMREQRVINEMELALDNEEFTVYFQPKYDLSKMQPSGAEALVRWKKPDGSMISPADFIPIFESNGFIIKLDYYVWERVCQFIKKSMDAGKDIKPISVNVSRVNLYNPKFLGSIIELVKKYDIPPKYLNLELTESVFSDNAEMMLEAVDFLHDAGFTIFMDDFGSGYSSLNILKDINLDVLKIDMKFLAKGPSNDKCEKIIAAVIKMAESLNLPVIAEGVEEQQEVEMLKRLGCDYIQGYYFAKPMPLEEYEKLIEKAAEVFKLSSLL